MTDEGEVIPLRATKRSAFDTAVSDDYVDSVKISLPLSFKVLKLFVNLSGMNHGGWWRDHAAARYILIAVQSIFHILVLPYPYYAYLLNRYDTLNLPSMVFLVALHWPPFICFLVGVLSRAGMDDFQRILNTVACDPTMLEKYRGRMNIVLGIATTSEAVVLGTYAYWMVKMIWLTPNPDVTFAWRAFFMVLLATAVFRLHSPVTLLAVFCVFSRCMEDEPARYLASLHEQTLSTLEVYTRHKQWLKETKRRFHNWQFAFVGLVAAPGLVLVAFLYLCLWDPIFLLTDWFFMLYGLHSLLMSAVMLAVVMQFAMPFNRIPREVGALLCSGKLTLSSDDAQGFVEYVARTDHVLRVLWLPMSRGTVRLLIFGLGGITLAIVQKYLHTNVL